MSEQNSISKDDRPERITIPRNLITQAGMSTGTLSTWLWLQALSQGNPPDRVYSVKELAALTGKSESTIYEHLRALRRQEELQWEKAGRGRFRLRLKPAETEPEEQEGDGTTTPSNKTAEQANERQNYDNPQIEQRFYEKPEDHLQNFGKTPSHNNDSINLKEVVKREGEFRTSTIPKNRKAESPGASKAPCGESPEAVYRSFTGRRPNRAQREELARQVHDLGRWRDTLAHWLTHGWSPINIGGMLEMYQRGGSEACRFCGKNQAELHNAGRDQTDPFEELLNEIKLKEAKGERRC
jgi:hypothetical protein